MSRKNQNLSHNDNPALLDLFKQDRFIKHLCNIIVDCEAPKGIGINGYWGTGKTTTLMRTYHQFCNEHPHGKDIQFARSASFTKKKIIVPDSISTSTTGNTINAVNLFGDRRFTTELTL